MLQKKNFTLRGAMAETCSGKGPKLWAGWALGPRVRQKWLGFDSWGWQRPRHPRVVGHPSQVHRWNQEWVAGGQGELGSRAAMWWGRGHLGWVALQLHDSIFTLPNFITGWGPGASNTALVWTRILGDQEKMTVTPIRVRERKERPPLSTRFWRAEGDYTDTRPAQGIQHRRKANIRKTSELTLKHL